MKKKPAPILRSLPIVDQLKLPDRAVILPQIESGELDHIDFTARVYRADTRNHNPYIFQAKDLDGFAASFEGQPFLRNHDTMDIDARDGTIIDSSLEGSTFKQTVRITTRRGMTDFVEGKIDRFSIGWFYDDILCSICNQSWFTCSHMPGHTYKVGEAKEDKICQLIFINPTGKETSAVNAPAIEGTGIDQLSEKELQEFKLSAQTAAPNLREVTGKTAATHARASASNQPLTKGGQMKRKAKVKVTNPETLEVSEVEGEIVEPNA